MNLFSIKDTVAKEFGPVFEAKNDDVAKRSFKKLVEKNDICPKEFSLYCLASFDHETGKIDFEVEPRFICDGGQLFQNEFDFEVKE